MLKLKNHIPLLLIITAISSFLATYGNWDIFKPAIYGSAFDSLAQNLLQLSAEVDAKAIGNEAMVIGDKYFMYYGPFPALLRLLLNLINPENYGNWTCFSKLLAYFMTLFFFSKICLLALKQNSNLNEATKSKISTVAILTLAFASPLFYLVIHNTIYSECISWGLSFSIAAIYFYLKDLSQSDDSNLVAMGLFTGLAILAKLTFALPLCSLVIYKLMQKKVFSKPQILICLVPLIILGTFQLWYNQARFGKLWQVYDTKARSVNAQSPAKTRSYKLAFFDLNRIPEQLKFYFSVDFKQIQSESFPYLQVYRNKLDDIEKYAINAAIFPLSLSSSLILLLALAGLLAAARNKESLIPLGFLVIQVILVLSFRCVFYRYQAEFIPLLVYLSFFSLRELKGLKNLGFAAVILLLIFNSYCSIFSSISRTALYDRSGKEKMKARYFLMDPKAKELHDQGHPIFKTNSPTSGQPES